MCGEWRSLLEEVGQPKGHVAPTLHYYWTLQLFVAGLAVGSAPVLFIGRGRHGRIRHQPDLTWVCWWRQVTEEEVHLCRVAAVGHHLYFFYCLGDVGEAARWYFYSLAGDRPGTLGADRHCRWREVLCCGCCFVDGGSGARWGMQKLGLTPHALPITCSRRAAVEGREGSD